jgi:hypothetical protein
MNKKESITTTGNFVNTFTRSKGGTFLLYGGDMIFPLSLRLAAYLMLGRKKIAVVDGCNKAGVHVLAKFAGERDLDIKEFLERVYVSRGFTCYQMEQAIVNELPVFLDRIQSRNVIILGLLDTMYDEQAPFREVSRMLPRILSRVNAMRSSGISILLTCKEYNVVPKHRNALFRTLKKEMDNIYKLTFDRQQPKLIIERQTDGKNAPDLYEHHRDRRTELVKV